VDIKVEKPKEPVVVVSEEKKKFSLRRCWYLLT
jgi:hypothetical protein